MKLKLENRETMLKKENPGKVREKEKERERDKERNK